MSGDPAGIFPVFGIFVVLVFICGLYCILVSRNLIRAIIGIELLIKGVTLLMVVAGYVTHKTALVQSFIITVIVIEVVIAATAGGIALRVFRHTNDLNSKDIERLKG